MTSSDVQKLRALGFDMVSATDCRSSLENMRKPAETVITEIAEPRTRLHTGGSTLKTRKNHEAIHAMVKVLLPDPCKRVMHPSGVVAVCMRPLHSFIINITLALLKACNRHHLTSRKRVRNSVLVLFPFNFGGGVRLSVAPVSSDKSHVVNARDLSQ